MNNLSILPNNNIADDPPAATPPPPPPKRPRYTPNYSTVKVIDFDMSFWNMVLFMIKWAFAAIPAMIIIITVTMFLCAALAVFGVFGALGLGALSGGLKPAPTPAHLTR